MSGVLEILACPTPVSVQDLGRPGYRHLGVPLSGALDPQALQLLNALLGNPPGAAALEMRLVGPTLRASAPVCVALAHAAGTIERSPDANGAQTREALPPWQTARLAAGDCLRIGAVSSGVGYLGVAGGIDVPPVLGSRSFYARAGIGLPLAVGTRLPVAAGGNTDAPRAVAPAPTFSGAAPLRVMSGPQADHFTAAAFATLCGSAYRVGRAAEAPDARDVDDRACASRARNCSMIWRAAPTSSRTPSRRGRSRCPATACPSCCWPMARRSAAMPRSPP